MFEHFMRPYTLAVVFVVVVVSLVYYRRRPTPSLPDNLPVLNTRDGEWFTRLRAKIRSTFNYKEAIHQAYQQVGYPPSLYHRTQVLPADALNSTQKITNHASSRNSMEMNSYFQLH